MAKSERRKARKAARIEGRTLDGELALDRGEDRQEFSESRLGYRARERWARRYGALNGNPAGPGVGGSDGDSD